MGVQWRVTQDGVSGPWGVSRGDLQLYSEGGAITLEAQDIMHSYKWELLSYPQGGSVTIVDYTSKIASLDLTTHGGYLIRLTVDEGLTTEDIKVLYLGIPLMVSGLPIPALNETTFDNRWLLIDGSKGWERKLTAWIKWIEAHLGGTGFGIVGQVSKTILATSTVTGSIDFNLSEGLVFKVLGMVTGSSEDCDIEFSASPYGTPVNLYQVGRQEDIQFDIVAEVTRSIVASSTVTGYLNINRSEGIVFKVTGSVVGDSSDCDMELAASAFGTPPVLYEIGRREVEDLDVTKSFSHELTSGSIATGFVALNKPEGTCFEVIGTVTGDSDDCNIEFSAEAYGTPTNLYEIGQDDEGLTLWNPSIDGNWEDRNAWGFKGLTAGRLYYRVSNNGANTVTMAVQIKVMGESDTVLDEPLWDPNVDGDWVDRHAWGFDGLTDGKLYYKLYNNDAHTIDMTLQVTASGEIVNPFSTLPKWNPDIDGDWEDTTVWGFEGVTGGKLYYRLTNNGPNQIRMDVQLKALGFVNPIGTFPGVPFMDSPEVRIKLYEQDEVPILAADNNMALWKDTNDGGKIYLIFRRGTGDQVAVELS